MLRIILLCASSVAHGAWLVRWGDCAAVYWSPAAPATVTSGANAWSSAGSASRLLLTSPPASDAIFSISIDGGSSKPLPEYNGHVLADSSLTAPGCEVAVTLEAALALAASVEDGIALAAPGTWRGADNCGLDFQGRAVTLRGVGGSDHVTLDCEDASHVSAVRFVTGETRASRLDGFHITRARSDSDGGGIRIATSSSEGPSSPSITNCRITDCAATGAAVGGGLSVGSGSSAAVSNVSVANCTATGGGGVAVRGGVGVSFEGLALEINLATGAEGGGGLLLLER